MRQVQAHLQSLTPYSQSRKHDAPKLDKETADAYDQRTWREKCTVNKDGIVVIPAMALKFALPTAAR